MRNRPVIVVLFCCFFISEVSLLSCRRWSRSAKTFNEDNLQKIFLKNLGLSQVPNVTRANITQSEMKEMIALYQRSLREDDDVYPADSLHVERMYTLKDEAPKTEKSDVYLLSFPLNTRIGSKIRGLSLHSAKLHIYKKGKRGRKRSAVVELYQLMKPSMLNFPQSHLMERRRVTFDSDGWEVFDVTEVVATWLEKPYLNHGFILKCKECKRRKLILVTANTDIDSDNRARLDMSVLGSFSRVKRYSNLFQTESVEEEEEDDEEEEETTIGRNCSEEKACCRYPMWISFRNMSWDWILHPAGFQAYYCKGECNHDNHRYANTHAFFQSLVHRKFDETIPLICCVPTSLKSLRIIHYGDSDPPSLIVSRLVGMIAGSCGCS